VLALMTEGLETPDLRHVTDDERSDYDRYEDSNKYSTREERRRRKRWTGDGSSGLILPSHRRTPLYDSGVRRRSGHAPRRAATAFMHSMAFSLSIFASFLFFYIPHHQPERSGFVLGHEEKETVFALPLYGDLRSGLFGCTRDVYSRRKTHLFPQEIIRYSHYRLAKGRDLCLYSCKFPNIPSFSSEGIYVLFMIAGTPFMSLSSVHTKQ
jgi:hypothetical protein